MKRSLLTLMLLVLPACAGPTDTTDPTPNPTYARCPDTIVIEDFQFKPAQCSAAPGTTLTFVNRDLMTHTATTTSAAPAPFDTEVLDTDDAAQVTLTEVGTYPYYCTTHPDMTATIVVE